MNLFRLNNSFYKYRFNLRCYLNVILITVLVLVLQSEFVLSQQNQPDNVRRTNQRNIKTGSNHNIIELLKSSRRNNSSNNFVKEMVNSEACECMDYWACASRKGQVYSYCGISEDEVCCFISSAQALLPQSQNNNISSSSEVVIFVQEEEITSEIPNTEEDILELSTTELNKDEKLTETTTGEISFSKEFITSIPINYQTRGCGTPSIPVKLDSKAQFREWPWHVAILEVTEDLYICGGALISNNRVITAAHCLTSYTGADGPRLKVRAGEYDVSGNFEPDPHVEILIDMMAIHPDFDNASLINDIAVVGLNRKINYTANIQPLCLPSDQDSPTVRKPVDTNLKCVVTGWGRTSEESNHSVVLKEVLAPLWNSDNCERRLRQNFGSSFNLPLTSICAGDEGSDSAICDGDGGGPLACLGESDGKWYHEGIVSFGIGCGRPDSPGVYTRVSSYLKWIRGFLS